MYFKTLDDLATDLGVHKYSLAQFIIDGLLRAEYIDEQTPFYRVSMTDYITMKLALSFKRIGNTKPKDTDNTITVSCVACYRHIRSFDPSNVTDLSLWNAICEACAQATMKTYDRQEEQL